MIGSTNIELENPFGIQLRLYGADVPYLELVQTMPRLNGWFHEICCVVQKVLLHLRKISA